MDATMDIEAFSDDNFNAVAWINSTYNNSKSKNDKEAFVSTLVSKLQLYIQQVNSALEDTSQQILSGLPRVMKDAQILQKEVLSLKTKMNEVQHEIVNVQSETGECMSNLERLDALEVKLQTAKQGLQESDGWGKLLADLEDHFEGNDLMKICEKLIILQKSLMAQEGLPGQNERESQVEGLKNRLEALASPSVVHYFSVGNIEQSQKYVTIFSNMNRLSQLFQYYRTVQKTSLQQHWSELIDLSENSNCFLQDFYDFIAENYQKQLKWCTQVFGEDATTEPLKVIVELLPSLQPPREAVILSSLKRSNEKLELLKDFSTANIHFAEVLQKQFESGVRPPLKHVKILSKTIFDYFNTFITQYPAIEQNFLATNLVNLNLSQPTATETIRTLGNANKKVLQWAKEACQRCEIISQNCGVVSLCSVLNSIFKTFIEKYKKAQQQLSASKNIEQNWSLLQSCISLLQNLGDFYISLCDFEKYFSQKFLDAFDRIQQSNEDYFGYRISEKRDIKELKKFALKIKENQQNLSLQIGYNLNLFNPVSELMKPICIEIHDTTLAAIFTPIESQLNVVELVESSDTSDAALPDYSFAPQEFITQIGQYLLTLPQHLEPLLLAPSASLNFALQICDDRYNGNIPCADVLLSLVVEEFCAMYQGQILQIKVLNSTTSKQLATDIDYIGNVLEELGLTLTQQLQQVATLLRIPSENYLAQSSGCDPRLVTAVRQMRHITSME